MKQVQRTRLAVWGGNEPTPQTFEPSQFRTHSFLDASILDVSNFVACTTVLAGRMTQEMTKGRQVDGRPLTDYERDLVSRILSAALKGCLISVSLEGI
jgi:hypothetical protein